MLKKNVIFNTIYKYILRIV